MSRGADLRALYRRRFAVTSLPEPGFDDLLRILEHSLHESLSGTVVHVMSGFGHLSVRMAKRWGARIVAVEPDDRLRAEAVRNNSYSGVIYMTASSGRFPVQNGEADAVVVVWGGGRLTDLNTLAAECRRVLRLQGRSAFIESGTADGLRSPPWSELPEILHLSSTFFAHVTSAFVEQKFIAASPRTGSVRIATSESELRDREEQIRSVGLFSTDRSAVDARLSDNRLIEQVQALVLTKDG